MNHQPKVNHSIQTLEQKISRNKELLMMLKKLQMIEESCWGRFFRFQNSKIFKSFDKRLTVYRTVRVRLDDLIYFSMLLAACLTFYFLPMTDQSHFLSDAYKYFLIYIIIFSAIWLASDHWFRHFFFIAVGCIFPVLTYVLYTGILGMDQVDTSAASQPVPQSLSTSYQICTLFPVLLSVYLIYPLKQFIRNKIGSLYSYLYAISFLVLFILWPMYSLINEYIKNNNLSFTFITDNQALIITFIVIITFSFYLLVHNTFFEGKTKTVVKYLRYQLSKKQIIEAFQGISDKQFQDSFVYQNYEIYTRVMSAIVFLFTLLIQIYSFIYLSNNLQFILDGLAVMVFAILFLVYGCIINLMPIPRSAVLYFSSIICIIPATVSSLYYSLSFYRYIFISCCLPYTTIYWCIIRSLSHRRPFLKTNLTVLLYIVVHIPVTMFVVNSLNMLTTDPNSQQIINIAIISILGLVFIVGILVFIIWLRTTIKQLNNDNIQKQKQIHYNYYEEGNPLYVPYKKDQSFSLAWLGSLDIRNVAQLYSCICFISCTLASLYILNQLLFSIDRSLLYSQDTLEIVISQLFISFIFFTYTFFYVILSIESIQRIIYIVLLWIIGIVLIISSYTLSMQNLDQFDFALILVGGVMIGIGAISIALEAIKRRYDEIDTFLSGFITILIWSLIIIPYAIAIPIASVYVSKQEFGMFIYYVILGSTLLLLILVSIIASVFNLLLGKFQQERKMKFMTQDVSVFLKEQGIQTEGQTLSVLYQSFQYRDKKYVFFLKRGFPIKLFSQNISAKQIQVRTIVYNQEQLIKKQSAAKLLQESSDRDCCWRFLTCLCGMDEDQIEKKVKNAKQKQLLDDEEMQELVNDDFIAKFLSAGFLSQNTKNKKGLDPSTIYSSKSISLKYLSKGSRNLGEQWVLLQKRIKERGIQDDNQKLFVNKKLQIQIWHQVFRFIANNDDPPLKIIYNDFLKFCQLIQLPENQLNHQDKVDLYFQYANHSWKKITALTIYQFAIIMEQISYRVYPDEQTIHPTLRLSYFLLNNVYPMLSYYSEFRDILNERKIKTRNNYSENRQNYINEVSQNLIESPFFNSYKIFIEQSAKNKTKKTQLNKHRRRHQQNKLVEPNTGSYDEYNRRKNKEKNKNAQKQKSCKMKVYDKYLELKNCCKKQEQEGDVIKRNKVKPWDFLAVQCVRIMERKQIQWRQRKQQDKVYQFKLILNNILIALFKFADLYTYLEITLMNPRIEWQSFIVFSTLIIQYRTQLYIAFGLLIISVIIGIKGISFILEDRLGLTQTRLPATFPHPMFLFTFLYKLLILSLFNTMIMTLLSTFMCNWENTQTTYYMILNQNQTPLQCFSTEHNIYLLCALIGIIAYYPLSAYTMPNFQFAEKTLDLKYKTTYLIIYFQVNFVLAAGKVLLSQIQVASVSSTTPVSQISTIQLVFQSINILSLFLLAISVLYLQPCLIKWFNYIQLTVVLIGLIWNVMGMVLYLTDSWLLCIIVSCSLTLLLIIIIAIFIRRKFFSRSQVSPEAQQDQIKQLEMNWQTRKNHHINLIKFQDIESQETNQQDVLRPFSDNKTGRKTHLSNDNKVHKNNQLEIQKIVPIQQNDQTQSNINLLKNKSKNTIQISDVIDDDSSSSNSESKDTYKQSEKQK